MNSKNPKRWETLLNDSEFELRIVRKTESRIKIEKRNRNRIISFSLFLFIFSSIAIQQWVIEPNELQSNMNELLEELSSESIVSLGID